MLVFPSFADDFVAPNNPKTLVVTLLPAGKEQFQEEARRRIPLEPMTKLAS